MPYDKKPGSIAKMYDKKGKPSGLMMKGSIAYMEGPGDPEEKKEEKKEGYKELSETEKLRIAGEKLGKDVSFEIKTFEDPRSSRSIVGIKQELSKKAPELYKQLYK